MMITLLTPASLVVGRDNRHTFEPVVVPTTTSPSTPTSRALDHPLSSRRPFSSRRHCIAPRCPAIYIGETGRTLRQRFGEHLRSIDKNLPGFPVAEHFNPTGHSIGNVLVRGALVCGATYQRKRLEMSLVFKPGTSHPLCLSLFLLGPRAFRSMAYANVALISTGMIFH